MFRGPYWGSKSATDAGCTLQSLTCAMPGLLSKESCFLSSCQHDRVIGAVSPPSKMFPQAAPRSRESTQPRFDSWSGILVTMSSGINTSQRPFSKCQTAVLCGLTGKPVWSFLWSLRFCFASRTCEEWLLDCRQVAWEPRKPTTGNILVLWVSLSLLFLSVFFFFNHREK